MTEFNPGEDIDVQASLIHAALLIVAGGNDLKPTAREHVTDAGGTVYKVLNTVEVGLTATAIEARRKARVALGQYLLMGAQGALEIPLDVGDKTTPSN